MNIKEIREKTSLALGIRRLDESTSLKEHVKSMLATLKERIIKNSEKGESYALLYTNFIFAVNEEKRITKYFKGFSVTFYVDDDSNNTTVYISW